MKTILHSIILCFCGIALQAQNASTNTCDSITIGDSYIVFEAEATTSDLGLWEVVKDDNFRYYDLDPVKPINGTHLEFTGNNHNSGPPTSPLEYKFTAPKTSTYRLVMRMYQRLQGQPEDKCNDVYIRMAGDFTSGSAGYKTDDLKKDMKFWGRGINKWGVIYNGEGGSSHTKEAVYYNLKKGEEYTFTMSGRAQRTNIDYILFFDIYANEVQVKSNVDLAENDAKYRPTACENTPNIINGLLNKDPGFFQLKTFPNPALKSTYLQLNNNVKGNFSLELINPIGQVIFQSEYLNLNPNGTIEIPLGNSQAGLYIIKLSSGKQTFYSKVLKR